ncbi:DUF4142 domain-containing protein [Advenella kashmirensis]|uniref:DUF4142 domain-containing protein n=1 Tax=Advenella kashmirensis TaxID=310575 RepID=UPI00054DBBC2|nr:DUF4142 domain-containing protein [Advenella kashmirensis]
MLKFSLKYLVLLSALSVFPVSASAQTSNTAKDSTADTAARPHENELASADEAFLKKAAEAGHAEVEAGKLAKQKASSADVKTFAEHMVTDHTKVNDELNALATNKGVELPAGPSSAQQAELKALGEESEEFDKQYVDRMAVTAHEEAVNMFKDASETSEDVDVKTFAKKTLPSLESHLDMAKSLKTKVGSDK